MFHNYDIKFVNGPIRLNEISLSQNICYGASVFFLGFVRVSSLSENDVHSIQYIVFEELALCIIRKIFFNIFCIYGRFIFLHVVQSKGLVNVGEPSIFIKVCAPHKESAFEICSFILKSIKLGVPIWKKEFTVGSVCWLLSSNKVF